MKLKAFILTTGIYKYLGLILKKLANDLDTKAMFIIYCSVLLNTAHTDSKISISGYTSNLGKIYSKFRMICT